MHREAMEGAFDDEELKDIDPDVAELGTAWDIDTVEEDNGYLEIADMSLALLDPFIM